MRDLIIALPLWAIMLVLLALFTAVSFAAREFVRRRCSAEDGEEFADQAPAREVPGLTAAASALETSAAGVSAVANRSLPAPLGALLLFIGALASIVMGITTVAYRRPVLISVWCLIPAVSIAVVLGLAFPFAVRGGFPLASLQAVLPGLVR